LSCAFDSSPMALNWIQKWANCGGGQMRGLLPRRRSRCPRPPWLGLAAAAAAAAAPWPRPPIVTRSRSTLLPGGQPISAPPYRGRPARWQRRRRRRQLRNWRPFVCLSGERLTFDLAPIERRSTATGGRGADRRRALSARLA